MKALTMMTALLAMSASAFAADVNSAQPAHGADMMYTFLTCHRVPMIPDYGFEIELKSGGFAGITTAQINRFFIFGHSSTETFVVKHPITNLMGISTYVDVETNGEQFKLTLPVTRPNADGTIRGTLHIAGDTLQLSCKYSPTPASN